ncbi:MAG: gamma-glutamyltransferase family protein [Negativicutes bacterium]|nr:gamma-glutamyltransferase family protein [Negativicutes bacterium]
MNYDSLYHPYPSRRSVVFAKKGMVATSQPLAAQAGLDILKKGGNAIDAAIATAACLTVVEPTSNGIGGDAFALVWTGGKLHGLNGSGPAPQSISIEAVKKAGYQELPKYGVIPVNVPGTPAAWAALSKRFGKLPLTEVLAPAIRYAEEGFPVSPIIGKLWGAGFKNYKAEQGEQFKHWFEVFAPQGRPPAAGEVWRSARHAATLQSIAETNAESFYRGDLAEKIDGFFKKYNGYLRKEDLEAFHAEWVDPIKVNYRGYDVWEIPPNGHGMVALMALNILKGFDFSDKDTVETYHRQIEAIKLAFVDGRKYITDPRNMTVKVEDLLSEAFAAERRRLIGREAVQPEPGRPASSGTVYLATADEEGNMVSYIQSNYMGFGSGLVVPETGISLHNRGHNFSFDPAHDNRLEGGKKPYHTIIPGFMTKDNAAVGPFGVMGGFIQPQGHVMVVMNTVDFHLNPQAALDAPRFQWTEGKSVAVEPLFPEYIAEALNRRGHAIKRGAIGDNSFGRGQIIWRDGDGVLAGGTEPRTDGIVAAW